MPGCTVKKAGSKKKEKKDGIKGLFFCICVRGNAAHMATRQTRQLVTALMEGKLHLVGPPSDALHIFTYPY